MADRGERKAVKHQRKAVKHEERQEQLDRRFDELLGRRGMRPRYAAYLVIVLWMIAVFAFGILERLVDHKTYPTIWDAWWWAIQTVTTVGYGDNPPQQPGGKVVASVLMIGGLAFLAVVTATITSSFVARRQEKSRARGDDPVMQQLMRLGEQVESLEAELRQARSEQRPLSADSDVSPR
jgi:voltage-gated potassium channel